MDPIFQSFCPLSLSLLQFKLTLKPILNSDFWATVNFWLNMIALLSGLVKGLSFIILKLSFPADSSSSKIP